MKKFGLVLAVAALASAAGCSSGGGGFGASAGHGSPKAAVDGFLGGLESSTSSDSLCSYVDPSDQPDCRQAVSEGARFHITGNLSVGNQVIEGNEALVVVTGNACLTVDAESTTTTDCETNSNQNAGLPSGAQSFSQAYSDVLDTSAFATVPCLEVDGQWYVNSQVGSSSSGTPPSTTTPSTTPPTTATTTPTSAPATSTPSSSPATTTPDTSPATTSSGASTTTTS